MRWKQKIEFIFLNFSPDVVEEIASKMLGYRLTTKQTPPGGVLVKKVSVSLGKGIVEGF